MRTLTTKQRLVALVGGALISSGSLALEKPEVGSGSYHWDSLEQFSDVDLSGQVITVFGPWLNPEDDIFNIIVSYFEAVTGADVQYAGSSDFEQQIVIDVSAGSPPNLAMFPQPGLAASLAAQGKLAPLGDELERWTQSHYAAGDSWVELGSFDSRDGQRDYYGFFYKVDLKSLVWYSPDNFEDYGYNVPESMEDLLALSEKMVADGFTPWCIGLGSGAATGWPATDWVEDLLLRSQPPEVYDGWVTNEVHFDDPRVQEAIELFGAFAKREDFVHGGTDAVVTTDFRDSDEGLFSIPPGCFMHRQASFMPVFFPEDITVGEDVDFFYFPAFDSKELGRPVLGAGGMFAITKDSDATRVLIDYLATPLAHELWMANDGFLTPHLDVNLDLYASDALRRQGEILRQATVFRFDASDLMPGQIGGGAFRIGMIDYVGGETVEKITAGIQKNWDAMR